MLSRSRRIILSKAGLKVAMLEPCWMWSKSSYALLWVLVAQASNASALPSHTAMTKPRSGLTTYRPRPSLSGLPAISASRPSVRFQSVANRSCFNPPVLEGNSPGLAMLPSSYNYRFKPKSPSPPVISALCTKAPQHEAAAVSFCFSLPFK